MYIMRKFKRSGLFWSHSSYLKKVDEQFTMLDVKIINTLLDHLSKLLIVQSSQAKQNKYIKKSTPYASGVGSIMYGMIYSKLNLAYAINIISWLVENLGGVHWGV